MEKVHFYGAVSRAVDTPLDFLVSVSLPTNVEQ